MHTLPVTHISAADPPQRCPPQDSPAPLPTAPRRIARFSQSVTSTVLTISRLVLLLLIPLSLISCRQETPTSPAPSPSAQPNQKSTTLTVAAASDLRYAMPELVSQFQRDRPGVSIKVTYGSSGNFFAQIAEGAPFDLFFSADQSYPLALIEQKKAAKETLRIYAIGQIVAWVPKESAIRIEELGLKAVLEPAVQKLAIANPRHAPYGRAAIAALQHFGWEEQVRPKLVMAENVAQAAQFVETSAADLGIIALSLAQSPVMAGKGRFWLIPSDSYPALEQASIIPAASSQQKLAEQFQSFVQGPDGQNILRQFGFTLPNP